MKKLASLGMAAVLAMSVLAGCGNSGSTAKESAPAAATQAKEAEKEAATEAKTEAEKEEAPAAEIDWPAGKPVTIYVSSGAGGMSDLGVRLLTPYLEEKFGTTFTVVNEKGGSGFVCWLNHLNDKPDGYTWIQVNDTMDYQTLNPQIQQTITSRDFDLLGCEVVDISALSCRVDEDRWTDLASLIEYAKNNEVTVSVSGLGTEDANVIYLMNSKLGTQFECVVAADGSAAGTADVIGGHVDIYSNNIASTDAQVKDGSLKALCVYNGERSQLWPDVPTFKEVTGVELSTHSARGLMMPKGGDPALVQYIVDGLKECTENPEYVQQMADNALEVVYYGPEDFQGLFDQSKTDVESILDVIGWK